MIFQRQSQLATIMNSKKLTSKHCHSIPVYVTRFGPYCEVNETTMFWRSFRANLQVAGYILPFCFLDSLILQFFFFTWLEVLEFLTPGVAACGPSMLLLWKEIIEKGNYNKQSKPGKIWCGASCGSIHTSQPSSKRFSLSHGQVIFNKGKFSFPRKIKLCS